MKIIIQKGFYNIEKSKLYIINRDFGNKKFRYNINSYLKILNKKLISIWKRLNKKYQFIQNNAFIYYTHKILK